MCITRHFSSDLVYNLGGGPLFDHGMIPFLMDLGLSMSCILWLLELRCSVREYTIPAQLSLISSISFMILSCMHQFLMQCNFFRRLVCALRSKTSVPTQALFTSSSPHSHRISNNSSYCEVLHSGFFFLFFFAYCTVALRQIPSLPYELYHIPPHPIPRIEYGSLAANPPALRFVTITLPCLNDWRKICSSASRLQEMLHSKHGRPFTTLLNQYERVHSKHDACRDHEE